MPSETFRTVIVEPVVDENGFFWWKEIETEKRPVQ